ncbi:MULTISPECIES: MarR family winged helix-turn-helix transcriptional regulator [unclassified Microbacterium]|uniref:MarR family winged helix-turn-helix transcriptional regulator n=1 Tax=unclassified Microbacterium TaxID=2609290 RepID=UPI0030102450
MTSAGALTALVDETFRLADAFSRAGDALVAEEGLTAARWLTLGAVAHGPLSVAGIARRRGMRRQSANESVAQLERAGLVVRRPDPADARAPLVHLTDEGRRALDRIRPRRLAWAADAAAGASEADLTAAVDLLRRIRTTLETGARDG